MPTDASEFERLVAEAYDLESGETKSMQALDALWRAVFELENWYFITLPEPDKAMYPLVGVIDGLNWFYAFTDEALLQQFARKENLVDEEKGAYLISVPTKDILPWLEEVRANGVYGIRFNQGDFGWYVPLENFAAIYEHLFS